MHGLLVFLITHVLLVAARVLADGQQHVLRLEGRDVAHRVELAHVPSSVLARLSSVGLA